tara:strand:+ start:1658 stop:1798 length:141 start_codon:yes stop_codon:yes gene_type:complete
MKESQGLTDKEKKLLYTPQRFIDQDTNDQNKLSKVTEGDFDAEYDK